MISLGFLVSVDSDVRAILIKVIHFYFTCYYEEDILYAAEKSLKGCNLTDHGSQDHQFFTIMHT